MLLRWWAERVYPFVSRLIRLAREHLGRLPGLAKAQLVTQTPWVWWTCQRVAAACAGIRADEYQDRMHWRWPDVVGCLPVRACRPPGPVWLGSCGLSRKLTLFFSPLSACVTDRPCWDSPRGSGPSSEVTRESFPPCTFLATLQSYSPSHARKGPSEIWLFAKETFKSQPSILTPSHFKGWL